MAHLHQPLERRPTSAAVYQRLPRDEAITRFSRNIGQEIDSWRKRSEFLRVDARLAEARERLASMALLAPNWDSYGAEPPNARSRALTTCILGLLQRQVMSPTRIVASAEGGVGIIFSDGERYADIECLNSGEILTAIYSGQDTPLVQEIGSAVAELTAAIERIRVHVAS